MQLLEIRKVSDEAELHQLANFMSAQPQLYPDFDEWVYGPCWQRIETGEAEGLLVVQDGTVVGDAVYRQTADPNTIRLNNFRIDPSYGKRGLGLCVLKQALAESVTLTGEDIDGPLRVITDVTVSNYPAVTFFIRVAGFTPYDVQPLYLEDQPEYLLEKMVPRITAEATSAL
jgi:hypothetical protein